MTSNHTIIHSDDGPYRDQKWPYTKIDCNVRLFLVRELQEFGCTCTYFGSKVIKKAFKDGCKRTNKFKLRRKFERNRRMKTKNLNFLLPINVQPIPVKPQDCCKIISASLILLFPDEIN